MFFLCKILRIPYTRHVTNAIARQTTGCYPVSHFIQERRLRFFGHVARADVQQDHYRVIEASLRPPSDWRRSCGRPRSTWLRGINSDMQSVNIEINSAWRKASDRTLIVDTATLHQGARYWRERGTASVMIDADPEQAPSRSLFSPPAAIFSTCLTFSFILYCVISVTLEWPIVT